MARKFSDLRAKMSAAARAESDLEYARMGSAAVLIPLAATGLVLLLG